jgi:excisionase family DNA binding protein
MGNRLTCPQSVVKFNHPLAPPDVMADTNKLTLKAMANRLSLSPKTLRKYVTDLGIPHYRIGGNLRFDAEIVEAYLMVTDKLKRAGVIKYPVRQRREVQTRFAEALGI